MDPDEQLERREALLSWDSVGLSKQAAVHAVQCRPVLALLLESRGVAMPARRAAEAITAALQEGQRHWTRYEFAAWFVQLQQRYAEEGYQLHSEPPSPHSPPPHQHQHQHQHQAPPSPPSRLLTPPPNRLLTPPLEPLDQPEAAARKSPRGGKLRGGDGNRGAHPRRSPPAASASASTPLAYELAYGSYGAEVPPHATGAQEWALEQVRQACGAAAREQSAEARDERARQLAALVPDETALVALASAGHDEARRES